MLFYATSVTTAQPLFPLLAADSSFWILAGIHHYSEGKLNQHPQFYPQSSPKAFNGCASVSLYPDQSPWYWFPHQIKNLKNVWLSWLLSALCWFTQGRCWWATLMQPNPWSSADTSLSCIASVAFDLATCDRARMPGSAFSCYSRQRFGRSGGIERNIPGIALGSKHVLLCAPANSK